MATHASFQISALVAVLSTARGLLDAIEDTAKLLEASGKLHPDLERMRHSQHVRLRKLIGIAGAAIDEDDDTGVVKLRKQLGKEGFPS